MARHGRASEWEEERIGNDCARAAPCLSTPHPSPRECSDGGGKDAGGASAVTEMARMLVERYDKTWTGEGAEEKSAVTEVARILVERYGKTWTGEGAEDRIGKHVSVH
ncbi:unnamed protein product, partial [Closterium sp. Naga37s-1]